MSPEKSHLAPPTTADAEGTDPEAATATSEPTDAGIRDTVEAALATHVAPQPVSAPPTDEDADLEEEGSVDRDEPDVPESFEPAPLRAPAEGPVQLARADPEGEPLSPVRLVEAALFTAGRPVSIAEICEATGLERRKADRAMKSLAMEYEERGDGTAMEVGQAGDKWAMQLKTRFVEHTHKLADMEIPKKTLKTLALIAFHQPVLQSDLVDMVGSRTYDHVRELHECGLIRVKPEGLSKRIVTSTEFPEYFGIPATDTERIRTYLAEKVGLTLKNRKGEASLSTYAGAEGQNGADTAIDVEPPEQAAEGAANVDIAIETDAGADANDEADPAS